MTKEIKISLAIVVLGALGLSYYWFGIQPSEALVKKEALVKEKILLPQYEKATYQEIAEVDDYLQALAHSLAKEEPFLPLESREIESGAKRVQALLLKEKSFNSDSHLHGKPLHNDMMRILPAIVSTLDAKSAKVCQKNPCYVAEKYNFVTNTTTRAIVDAAHLKVLSVERYASMQPDISLRLTHLAQAIALHAPEVKKALGFTPRKKDITMANVRGTMKESPCENTTHLCVAPTFSDHQKEQALWAVVDLTELRLAAAKWAGLGKTTTPACIGERSLQNRYIMENFCQKENVVEKNGWHITYRLTGSDGLEIRDVTFQGKGVLTSAKIVDWHVSYKEKGQVDLDNQAPSYMDGRSVAFVNSDNNHYLFGYNDAMGCPLFSTSVVLAFNGPQVKPLPQGGGFMLTQDFRNPKWPMACNYRYENRFEFYDDGSFRVVGVNKGRGCGDHAIYRPVMRIDMDLGGKEKFYTQKRLWEEEGSTYVPNDSNSTYPYKILSSTSSQGYYIEPNHGQFHDKSRGDFATLFVSKFKASEGDKDLLTLGSCCNLKEDGVEPYVKDRDSIVNENLVLWYVPRIRNDTRQGHEYCWADTFIDGHGNMQIKVWPCTVGPKFIPLSKGNR